MSRVIRHQTQLGIGLKNACGQTCAAMMLSATLDRPLSALQVARDTGNTDGSFTDFNELIGMFAHYGVKATHRRPANFAWWASLLSAGGAGIALIDHASHPNNGGYLFAHFICIAGITPTHIITHNPLYRDGPTLLTHAEFTRCIDTPSRFVGGTNWPQQGVVIEDWYAAPVPTLAERVAAVAREVRMVAA
jgi:hypothetical protein